VNDGETDESNTSIARIEVGRKVDSVYFPGHAI
jgi:hypothetical protein